MNLKNSCRNSEQTKDHRHWSSKWYCVKPRANTWFEEQLIRIRAYQLESLTINVTYH